MTQVSKSGGIFRLPTEIRQSIFKQVLAIGPPLYLFTEGGGRVETFMSERPLHWLALLFVNRQIGREAVAMLYASNRFSLMDTIWGQAELLQSFLDCIGPINAGFVSHFSINFPVAGGADEQLSGVHLREDSLLSLKLLQEMCTSLTTLELLIHCNNSHCLTKLIQEDSPYVMEVLTQTQSQLNAIISLKRIVIRVHDGTPTPFANEMMQEGWVVLVGNKERCNRPKVG